MNPKTANVENIPVDSRISDNVTKFLAKAREKNKAFHLISGYRSVEMQTSLYNGYIDKEMKDHPGWTREQAEKQVQTYSQPPKASEHETGLAIDISTVDSLNQMSKEDAKTLTDIASDYGFVKRFEGSKKSSTGVDEEDWHFRYVGKENAEYMKKHNLSLEEYINQLKESGVSDDNEDCSDDSDSDSGGATDGSGKVPTDATAWGYKPEDVPKSLKQYIIDPKTLGMSYGNSSGWYNPGSDYLGGQCVNLTVSLGNQLWGHSGSVSGNGKDQATAWASIFGNSVKTTPKRGAIFSTQNGGGGYGHTGIVCHVFEDGSILIVEQNTPLSGVDFFKKSYTWNYRVWTPDQQKAEITTFAYPDNKEPKLKK
ncbi:D-alanyl-D-alanine carboxypeptidase family protein [Streptococcus sobrinus]